MKTDEAFLGEIHKRAYKITADARNKRNRILTVSVSAISLAALIALVLIVPSFRPAALAGDSAMHATIMASNEELPIFIVGILSFLLGVTVTVICFRLKERK